MQKHTKKIIAVVVMATVLGSSSAATALPKEPLPPIECRKNPAPDYC